LLRLAVGDFDRRPRLPNMAKLLAGNRVTLRLSRA
jgi:hypothetical protein